MSEASAAIGDLTSLQSGQVLLPAFVTKRDSGLWVDISALDSPGLFQSFVERVFGSGARFAVLDYAVLNRLLYELDARAIDSLLQDYERAGKAAEVRIAADVVAFPAERQALYRDIKFLDGGQRADYFFEQISIDHEVDGHIESVRAFLDFDEFVAAAWQRGLKFGIDEALVRDTIAADRSERLTLASQKPPVEGKDASISELAQSLNRNDAPHIRSDGRMDLTKFQNRFPQVTEGQRLFRKLPRIEGQSGRDVQGKELPPGPVKDFAIRSLAGPGTRIEQAGDDEYVVAAIAGFLDIDAASGVFAVTEKIVNRAGVSVRTTGNLTLSGEHYEEHGDVQEKRIVEGHHMDFFADVYGKVISDGGRIWLKRGIVGGLAQSSGGTIVAEGAASRATLEARGGVVNVAQAESCLIVAKRIEAGTLTLCDLVADEVVVERAEGCAIAARSITIRQAAARRGEGNVINLLLPDLAALDRAIESACKQQQSLADEEQKIRARLTQMSAEPDLKTYLALQPKIKAGLTTLKGEQEKQWLQLTARIAPALRELSKLNAEVQQLKQRGNEASDTIKALRERRQAAIREVRCGIEVVSGDTAVRQRVPLADSVPVVNLGPKDLRLFLRAGVGTAAVLFHDDTGALSWSLGGTD